MSSTTTSRSSPNATTSSTRSMRRPRPSLEMCTKPSRPGRMFTKAPKEVMLTTLPLYTSPTSAVGGSKIRRIWRSASSTQSRSGEEMVTMPESWASSTLTSAPVSDCMALMTFPLGPITSPILSSGISNLMILGAVGRTSSRGAAMAPAITSKILSRASRAWLRAPANTSAGRPSILVSSCSAVTKSAVPATLKSMSPKASSAPKMSVRVV